MADAIPYAPDVLTGNPESTDWVDARPLVGSFVLIVTVTGTATFYVDISNDARMNVTKDFSSSVAYTASFAKVLDADRMPDFVRVRKTGGSGSIAVSFGMARNKDGKKGRPASQSELDN